MEHYLYLSHHGVKGMKWGVRKERSSSGDLRRKATSNFLTRLAANRKKKVKPAKPEKLKKAKRKKVKDMSEAELQEHINRLQLERRLKDVKRQNTGEARAMVKDILKNSFRSAATATTTQIMKYAMATAVNSVVKSKIPGGIIDPGGPKSKDKDKN